MDFKRNKDGNLVEIDGRVRVESGPVHKSGIATAELLSNDITAGHYQVGKFDSEGKVIELGKKMGYIDWKSDKRAWYVYELTGTKEIKMVAGGMVKIPYWEARGVHDSEDGAMGEAMTIATKPAKGGVR